MRNCDGCPIICVLQENRIVWPASQREPQLGDSRQPARRHRDPRRGHAIEVQRGLPQRIRDRQGLRHPPAERALKMIVSFPLSYFAVFPHLLFVIVV